MALHLITGYAGQEHITSADQGAYNMGTFGEGEFVLDRGNKFAATVVTNNQITIADGEALMQGRFIKLPVGTTESVMIDNGASGMKRKDLIVLRYTKNASTGVETVSLAVKKGTASSGTPSDPAVTTGTITDGTDLVNEMKLYRVNLDGLNIVSIDTLFSVKTTMVEYMDEYQLPPATADMLGGIKVGVGLQMTDANQLRLKGAGAGALGGIRLYSNDVLYMSGEYLNLRIGNGLLKDDNGNLCVKTASNVETGGVKVQYNRALYIEDGNLKLRMERDYTQSVASYITTPSNKSISVGYSTVYLTFPSNADEYALLRESVITGVEMTVTGGGKVMASIGSVNDISQGLRVELNVYNHYSDAKTITAVYLGYFRFRNS